MSALPPAVGSNSGTSPLEKLHVQGNVRADGSFISNGTTLNVPDYVFEPDYKLRPLKDLALYIEKEKHLSEIPPAKEINASGVDLSAFHRRNDVSSLFLVKASPSKGNHVGRVARQRTPLEPDEKYRNLCPPLSSWFGGLGHRQGLTRNRHGSGSHLIEWRRCNR